MRIKDISKENRPRERFQKLGASVLSDAELLAIILQKGSKEENVIDMSNRLISKYGLDKLSDLSLKELQEIRGIGPAKAMQIKALFEFNKRHDISKQKINYIKTAKDVFDLFYEKLKDEKQENFYILMLNTKNYVIGEKLITRGTLDSTIIHPREIFKPAIKNSASKIILIHNHPSGDPFPSGEDVKITKKIREASKLIGIEVSDHVIIGNKNYYSFKKSYLNF